MSSSYGFDGPVPVPAPQAAALHVLVTGASRGIGFELVRQYAQAHPDNLVFAAVRNPSSDTAKAVVPMRPPIATYTSSHSTSTVHDSVQASVAAVLGSTQHLDLLINNAGETSSGTARSALTTTAAEFERLFHTNTTGTLMVSQAYLPLLRKSSAAGGARVVNVSSALGSTQFATVFGPTVGYGVSKAAINYLTRVFAHEVPDVTFLAIHPGVVQTNMAKGAGVDAPVTVSDCAQAIRHYIEEKGVADSGMFLYIMTGKPLPY